MKNKKIKKYSGKQEVKSFTFIAAAEGFYL